MKSPKLRAEEARELFNYDPETGALTWKVQNSNRSFKGRVAGGLSNTGYLEVRVNKTTYLVHRLVWLIHTGSWPEHLIDHLNGVRTDNRIVNLRDVPRRVNQENQRRARCDSQTGVLGVYAKRNKFSSSIGVCGRRVYLGVFDTPLEAHQAYLTAKRALHAGCTI